MTVLQFSDFAQGTTTDSEEELRIQQKEAIYRGLIEVEAKKYGETFEEAEDFENEKYRILEAEDDTAGLPDLHEVMAKKKGISPYEAKLDLRIGFLQSLNTYAPNFRCPTRLTHG